MQTLLGVEVGTDKFAEFFSPRAMDRGGLFAMHLSFTDSLCTCTVGQNNCAHAAGVLVYVGQLCRHVRVLNEDDEGEVTTQSTSDAEVTPPSSNPRAWGLPSQKQNVTPSDHMEQLN